MDDIITYYLDLDIMIQALPALWKGVLVTLQLAAVTIIGGLALALFLAVVRAFQIKFVNFFIIVFVDVFRALPPIVVIILVYFALPYVDLGLSSFWSASLALVLVLAAVAEEIFWSGIIAVEKGQWEAARSTGLGFLTTLVLVITPQGVRMVIPPLTNKVISITKNTALASVVAEPELLNQAMTMQGVFANPSPLFLGAVMYVLIFLPFVIYSRFLERRITYPR